MTHLQNSSKQKTLSNEAKPVQDGSKSPPGNPPATGFTRGPAPDAVALGEGSSGKPAGSSPNNGRHGESGPYGTGAVSPSELKNPLANPRHVLKIHEHMVTARATEEQCIRMSRAGDGWFWIGAPGEEALGVPIGMQVNKGEGLDHDYLHLHYRSSPVVIPMGVRPIDVLRQMAAKATDPFSRGRNFVNHYAIRKWNVLPMAPTIETQYAIAIGTGIAQRRHGGSGITIVNGGDGGTHEGDFASCLIWSTRPGAELPVLMITANNKYAISTQSCSQHGTEIVNRARGFKIPAVQIDGNDLFETWRAVSEAMEYVRRERKPYFIEAAVSRLNGHSSSSGANRVDEEDCIVRLEEKILKNDWATRKDLDEVWRRWRDQVNADYQVVKHEPYPDGQDIWKYIFSEPKDRFYPDSSVAPKRVGGQQ
jgi:2-oxoisovalerate dehydrogenase E1 component alpha subunit